MIETHWDVVIRNSMASIVGRHLPAKGTPVEGLSGELYAMEADRLPRRKKSRKRNLIFRIVNSVRLTKSGASSGAKGEEKG